MDFLRLSEFSTLLALGYRATLLLDFEEWAVGVMARRRSVPFDARFTAHKIMSFDGPSIM